MLKPSVWSGLPDKFTSELFANATSRRLKAGDTLFKIGDIGDGCYQLDNGVLKVSLISAQFDERIVAILTSGAIVGDLAMIDGEPRSASVVALTDCELRFVSRITFQNLAQQHPEIYRNLTTLLATRLRETDRTIASWIFSPLKSRLARALLELANSLGEKGTSGVIVIRHRISQRDLAAMAGVSRENANRVLNEWERKNVVTKPSRSYQIEDKAKLEREIDCSEHLTANFASS